MEAELEGIDQVVKNKFAINNNKTLLSVFLLITETYNTMGWEQK